MYWDSEWIWLVLLVAVVFNVILAAIFGNVAEQKGHTGYFWIVFIFGLIGCLVVVALPDRKAGAATEENSTESKQHTPDTYSTLFQYTDCLYAEGAPVVITDGQLLKNDSTGDVHIRLGMTNIQSKPIIAVVVQITTFDYAGRVCGEKIRHHYLDLHAEQDDVFGTSEDISVKDPSIRHFQAAVVEVVYADMTIWQGDDMPWDELKALTPLQEKFADDELVKQYKLQLGEDCAYYPTVIREKKLWTCACGAFNSMTSGVCHKCQRSYTDMVSPEMLKKLVLERERLLAEKKRAEEERKRKEEELERQRKKDEKIGNIITAILSVACGIFIIVLIVATIMNNT